MVDSAKDPGHVSLLSGRVRREIKTVQGMIRLYCRANHRKSDVLCDDCELLLEYARKRLQKCPFQENKTTCSNCAVHCYHAEMKARIIEVMRFSGPRMLLHHPFLAIAHLLDEKITDGFRSDKNLSPKKQGIKKR